MTCEFGERFYEMIQTEPDAPTVMVEGHRKDYGHGQKNRDDCFVVRANQREARHVSRQNHKLCCDYVDSYCSYEETFLAFEERVAVWAVESYVERALED